MRTNEHVHFRVRQHSELALQLGFLGANVVAELHVALDHRAANQRPGINELAIPDTAHVLAINGCHVPVGLRNEVVLVGATCQRETNQADNQNGARGLHNDLPFFLQGHSR